MRFKLFFSFFIPKLPFSRSVSCLAMLSCFRGGNEQNQTLFIEVDHQRWYREWLVTVWSPCWYKKLFIDQAFSQVPGQEPWPAFLLTFRSQRTPNEMFPLAQGGDGPLRLRWIWVGLLGISQPASGSSGIPRHRAWFHSSFLWLLHSGLSRTAEYDFLKTAFFQRSR